MLTVSNPQPQVVAYSLRAVQCIAMVLQPGLHDCECLPNQRVARDIHGMLSGFPSCGYFVLPLSWGCTGAVLCNRVHKCHIWPHGVRSHKTLPTALPSNISESRI